MRDFDLSEGSSIDTAAQREEKMRLLGVQGICIGMRWVGGKSLKLNGLRKGIAILLSSTGLLTFKKKC